MPLPAVGLLNAMRACIPGRTAVRARSRAAASRAFAAGVVFALALTACNQLEPVAITQPTTDLAKLYMRLTLNHPAVNLTANPAEPAASTLQLVATPYDGTGAPIADAPAPTFTLLDADTTIVKVFPDGRLQGLRAAFNAVKVAATLVLGGVRHSDTAVVKVHDFAPAPVLETFSLEVPAEQAVWYKKTANGYGFLAAFIGMVPPLKLSPQAVAAGGEPITGLAMDFGSLDSSIATVDRRSGAVTAVRPGYVRVVAQTMAFGVAKAATATYTVQESFVDFANVDEKGFYAGSRNGVWLDAPTVKIAAGGMVYWVNSSVVEGTPVNVTFDDPTNVTSPPAEFCDILPFVGVSPDACGAGDIPTYTVAGFENIRFRRFPVPGIYPYQNTTTGARGTIDVAEPLPPPAP